MPPRYVLVGAGPASISAAEAIRENQPGAEIISVTRELSGYYSRPGLAYFLAREVPEARLFPFSREDFARLDLQLVFGKVTGVDRASREVQLDTGQTLRYDRLLLATGAKAVAAGVPGDDLDGVVKLDHLEDARDIVERSRRANTAVVVGGGITALEVVEGLRARGVKVHYFMRKGRYWGNVLSEAESRIVEDGLRRRGVQLHYRTELTSIAGLNGRVVAAETNNGERVECQMLAVSIGVLPRKELPQAAGLTCARGVVVDEFLRSSDPDIFAAGDLAEVTDPESGRGTLEVLWSSATAKGRVAGLNMSRKGEPTHKYEKGTPLNVTRLAGAKVTIMGRVGGGEDADLRSITRGDSETWRRAGDPNNIEWQSDGLHLRLALTGATISGAVVMGDQEISFPLQELISAGADIGAIQDRLLLTGAPVPELVSSAWLKWRGAR